MVKTFVTRGLSIFYYFLKVKKRLICISNPIQTILDLKLESYKALLCENNCYPIISILYKSFFFVQIAVLMYFLLQIIYVSQKLQANCAKILIIKKRSASSLFSGAWLMTKVVILKLAKQIYPSQRSQYLNRHC